MHILSWLCTSYEREWFVVILSGIWKPWRKKPYAFEISKRNIYSLYLYLNFHESHEIVLEHALADVQLVGISFSTYLYTFLLLLLSCFAFVYYIFRRLLLCTQHRITSHATLTFDKCDALRNLHTKWECNNQNEIFKKKMYEILLLIRGEYAIFFVCWRERHAQRIHLHTCFKSKLIKCNILNRCYISLWYEVHFHFNSIISVIRLDRAYRVAIKQL